jgi:DNA-directed RNA polymerase subunit beta
MYIYLYNIHISIKKSKKHTDLEKLINLKIKNKKGIFFINNEKEKKHNFATNKNIQIIRQKNEFIEKTYKKINYIAINTNTVTSIGTSLIPFIEHNDGNRTLMGSNMQKQAIPIKKKEKALLQTGNESKVGMESSYITRAKKAGLYKYNSCDKIIIKVIKDKTNYKPNSFSTTNKKKKKMKKNHRIMNQNQNPKEKIYHIQTNPKTNQNLYIKQDIIKKNKTWIKKGEILTNNSHVNFGKLCLGKNLLIGYMPLEGYNFEDAIIISKKIVKEKSLTSKHIKKYLTFKEDNEMGKVQKLTNKFQTTKRN